MQLPGLGKVLDHTIQDATSERAPASRSMPLPGLGLSAAPRAEIRLPTIHELKEGTEWRFEVAFGASVEVKVLPRTI